MGNRKDIENRRVHWVEKDEFLKNPRKHCQKSYDGGVVIIISPEGKQLMRMGKPTGGNPVFDDMDQIDDENHS